MDFDVSNNKWPQVSFQLTMLMIENIWTIVEPEIEVISGNHYLKSSVFLYFFLFEGN